MKTIKFFFISVLITFLYGEIAVFASEEIDILIENSIQESGDIIPYSFTSLSDSGSVESQDPAYNYRALPEVRTVYSVEDDQAHCCFYCKLCCFLCYLW